MELNTDKVQDQINEAISYDQEGVTKTSLNDIPEIEEKDWLKLKENLHDGQIQVREMTTSQLSFKVFASDGQKVNFTFLSYLAMATPIVAIILAFIYSWWVLLLAFGHFFFLNASKSLYKTVIFEAVTFSEIAFCFLFSRNTICLLGENEKLIFRENV